MKIIVFIKKKHPWATKIIDFIKKTILRQYNTLILLRKTARDNEGEMSARAASSHEVNFCQTLGAENAKDEVGPLEVGPGFWSLGSYFHRGAGKLRDE